MKAHLAAIASFLLALVFAAGCTTEHYITDARHPEVAITADGGVTYRGKYVDLKDLPGLLKDSGLTKQDTINIHVSDDLRDIRAPRRVMGYLSRNGFTRPILISERRSYAQLGKTADERRVDRLRQQQEQMKLPPAKRAIRYK